MSGDFDSRWCSPPLICSSSGSSLNTASDQRRTFGNRAGHLSGQSLEGASVGFGPRGKEARASRGSVMQRLLLLLLRPMSLRPGPGFFFFGKGGGGAPRRVAPEG